MKHDAPSRLMLWLLTACVVFFVAGRAWSSFASQFMWSSSGIGLDSEQPMRVTRVDPDGAGGRAGIEVGDVVVRPDGSPYQSFREYGRQRREAEREKRMALTIRKPDGNLKQVTLYLQREEVSISSYDFFFWLTINLILFISSGVGLAVCWLRWEDATARAGGLFFISLIALFGSGDGLVMSAEVRLVMQLMAAVMAQFSGYFCFTFFSEFPTASLFANRWRWARTIYALLLYAILPVPITLIVCEYISFDMAARASRLLLPKTFDRIGLFAIWIGFALPFLTRIRFIGGNMDIEQRRRFRVFTFGSLLGGLPMLLLIFAILVFKVNSQDRPWLIAVPLALFPLFPLSFAYVVIKHRVLGIQQILRIGLQYLFVSRGYLALEVLLFYLATRYLIAPGLETVFGFFNYVPSAAGRPYILLGVTGFFVLVASRVNPRFQSSIDRRFFREAYQAQQVLRNLAKSVRHTPNPDDMLRKVAETVDDALHVKTIGFLLHPSLVGEGGGAAFNGNGAPAMLRGFACRFEADSSSVIESELAFPMTSPLLHKLQSEQEPMELDVFNNEGIPYGKHPALRKLESNLLIPLLANDTLLGVFSLGPKLSEEPYTREDKALLMSVAESAALRLENTQLIRRLTVEATVRRELEIAREMQQSLLPGAAPEVPGVELAGYSVAANDVGGDYYDYFVLDESRLAVAVGDVTGHGVSSGLLMALAKGGLHNQVAAEAAPAPVMAAMNRLICQSAGKRNLMSFVYAVVNAKTRTVELANAGHPFPYCFNAAERTVSAIEIGAYPLGVRVNSTYAPVEVKLEPGDAMVFYSDGIVEAQNPSGEVFGFERFEKAILRHGSLSATAMQEAILEEVRAFLGPQPMEDDVTLVVVRMQK